MTMQSTLFVFGLAMLIAIELLRWLAGMPAEVGTALSSIAWLMIAGPAAISARANRTPPDERGFARPLLLLLVAVLAGVVLVLAPGCASTRVDGTTMGFRLRDDPKRPAPACLYRHTVDGVLLDEGALDDCPEVPVCREPSP